MVACVARPQAVWVASEPAIASEIGEDVVSAPQNTSKSQSLPLNHSDSKIQHVCTIIDWDLLVF